MPIHVRTVNLEELGFVEVVAAKQITHSVSRHLHESLCIGIIQSGSRKCIQPHTSYEAVSGQVFIVNPGEVHACCSGNAVPYDYAVISIKNTATAMLAFHQEMQGVIPYFPHSAFFDEGLFNKISTFIHLSISCASLLELQTVFLELIAHLVLSYGKEPASLVQNSTVNHTAITEVYQYIEHHCADEISLAQLSDRFHISSYHLTRSFTKQFGIPPHVCQTLFRIKQAKQLLAAGTPLADAAIATGFVDQSHLSRRFKEVVGMTPGRWLSGRTITSDSNGQ